MGVLGLGVGVLGLGVGVLGLGVGVLGLGVGVFVFFELYTNAFFLVASLQNFLSFFTVLFFGRDSSFSSLSIYSLSLIEVGDFLGGLPKKELAILEFLSSFCAGVLGLGVGVLGLGAGVLGFKIIFLVFFFTFIFSSIFVFFVCLSAAKYTSAGQPLASKATFLLFLYVGLFLLFKNIEYR